MATIIQRMRETVQWTSGINVVAGLWLIIAPFVLGYEDIQAALWNDVLVGIMVAAFAVARLARPLMNPSWSWINALLGLWLIVAPFVLAAAPELASRRNAASKGCCRAGERLLVGIDRNAVAASAFRLVQRRIGACIPFGTAFAGMRSGHPDRERDPLAHFGEAAHHERAGRQELAKTVGDPDRVVGAGSWQQEPKLIPTHARNQAVAPDISEEHLAHDTQDLVADVVPVSVVDALEVIDVGHDEVSG
jgi:hypothetical protein